MKPLRVAIFASGTGSNAEALIRQAQELPGKIQVSFVLSDQPQAGVLGKAAALDVPTHVIPRRGDRVTQEAEILQLLRERSIDWIFLAGYMRLLSAEFLRAFATMHEGRTQVVNIHPSLLPAYPGKDSIRRAYEDGVSVSGVTLHFVDQGMDTGPIISQHSLPRRGDESLQEWSQLFHRLEHQIYCQFLRELAAGSHFRGYLKEVLS